MWSTNTYTNDVAPTADDVALNALVAEQSSLVVTTGQTPDQAITNQIGKGVGILASGAVDQYTISGGPGAYIATPIAPVTPISPTGLFTGLRVRGVFNVTNTGGAMTINPNGIGATSVKLIDGTDPVAGDLLATQQVDMFHDGVNFVVTTEVASIILGLVPPATNVEMEAAALNNVFVTPLNFLQSPFAIKALISFDGTVPGSGAAQTILFQKNISSVTRVGSALGTYEITFVTPFTSVNYLCLPANGGSGVAVGNSMEYTIISTSVCRVLNFQSNTTPLTPENSDEQSVIFIGEV